MIAEILKENDIEKYNIFLKNNPRCNFQQSIEWAKLKKAWKNEIILVKDDKQNIVGAMSVLIRKIPIFGNLMYSGRGPVCDVNNKEILELLTNEQNKLAKQYNAFVVIGEPDVKSDNTEYINILKEQKYIIKNTVKTFDDAIQPRYVFRLDIKDKTEDEIFNNFSSKTRYNIRVASKKGVIIKEGTKDDLKEFSRIMEITGQRDNFITRPLSYFEKMFDELAPNHFKLLMAYYNEQPISGIIGIIYGNKTWYLYGASSNEYRNLMPNYLLQWELIKNAIRLKQDMYDFRGVVGVVDENHPQYGLYRFKKGFGAEFTEFIGETYIVYDKLRYKAYKIFEKILKKYKKLKRENISNSYNKKNKNSD